MGSNRTPDHLHRNIHTVLHNRCNPQCPLCNLGNVQTEFRHHFALLPQSQAQQEQHTCTANHALRGRNICLAHQVHPWHAASLGYVSPFCIDFHLSSTAH